MDQDKVLIAELEHAAKILKSSECLDKESREIAEKVFIDFRKMKLSYKIFHLILETSNTDFVLFSAVGCMINTITRDCICLDLNEIGSLRIYLMNYIMSKQLQPFLVERFVILITTIIKIESIQDGGVRCRQIVLDVLQLLNASSQHNDLYKEIVCCKLILSLYGQYSLRDATTYIEISYLARGRMKLNFEFDNVINVLRFFLQYAESKIKSRLEVNESLLTLIISVIYESLIWPFLQNGNGSYYLSMYEVDYTDGDTFKKKIYPENNLTRILFDSNFVAFMFSLCDYCHKTEQYVLAYDCLHAMATLECTELPDDKFFTYYQRYIENSIILITQREIDYKLAICASRIFSKMVHNLRHEWYKRFPSSLLDQFLSAFAAFTLKIIECAFLEEMGSYDNDSEYFQDSLNNCLTFWSMIVKRKDDLNQNILKQSCTNIFMVYYKHHLKNPEGVRPIGMKSVKIEINEFEESDRVIYNEELQTIGYISIVMSVLEFPINCLTQIIDDRTNKLYEYFTQLHKSPDSCVNLSNLDDIFDDLNWSLLISSHMVINSCFIPKEIINFSNDRLNANNTNIEITIGYLKQILSSNYEFVLDTVTDSRCDPIVKLFYSVLRLTVLENLILSSQNRTLFSPEVSSSIVWFLYRFIESYYCNSSLFKNFPIVYKSCFQNDTETQKSLADFLLKKVEINIMFFNAEVNVMDDTMNLLNCIGSTTSLSSLIIKSKVYQRLVEFGNTVEVRKLSKGTLKKLFCGLILATYTAVETNEHEMLIYGIINHYVTQLSMIINSRNNSNFQTYCLNNIEKNQIIIILDILIGSICGLNKLQCIDFFFCILKNNVFNQLNELMVKYCSQDQVIVKSILKVYEKCSIQSGILTNTSNTNDFLNNVFLIIDNYFRTQYQVNNLMLETCNDNNEDLDCLLIIFKIAINVIDNNESLDSNVSRICWTIIMNCLPLIEINPSMIAFHKLFEIFYKLLSLTAKYDCEYLTKCSIMYFTKLVQVIELGLNCASSKIQTLCCSSIMHLAKKENPQFINLLKPFLSMIFRLIFDRSIKVGHMSDLSDCLFSLMTLVPNELEHVAETFVNAQNGDIQKQKLYSLFNNLSKGYQLELSEPENPLFGDFVIEFIIDIQAFSFVR